MADKFKFFKGALILAPMAGYTNHYYRPFSYKFGADFTFTEMVSSEGLIRRQRRTFEFLKNIENEPFTIVQIFGGKPDIVAEAAKIVVDAGAQAVDINMGCPVKKVVRHGSGVALMKDMRRAAEMIAKTRAAVSVHFSVKIRAGYQNSEKNYNDFASMAEREGVDAITVHPRTRTENYSTSADWEIIKQVVNSVSIPVIGNGDIFSPEDALLMQNKTKCFAIMIARTAVRNPWIFKQIKELKNTGKIAELPSPCQVWELIETQMNLIIDEMGEKKGIPFFRKFLTHYLYAFEGASKIKGALFKMKTVKEIKILLSEFLCNE